MRKIYLLLAVVGAVIPYYFFIQFFSAEGVSLGSFLSALFINGAARGLSSDLLITSFVFWMYMIYRRAQGKGPNPILFVILNLGIGLSCALPAYFYATADTDG